MVGLQACIQVEASMARRTHTRQKPGGPLGRLRLQSHGIAGARSWTRPGQAEKPRPASLALLLIVSFLPHEGIWICGGSLKRLMIFIDNSNIFRGSRREGIKFDYQKLVDFLADSGIQRLEKYDLTRVIMYCAVDRSQPDDKVRAQEALYSIFNSFIKFDVKTFDLKVVQAANGDITDKYEKGVDVALVTDLLLLASRNAFDVAIICAGDADFFRAVEGVKEMGKEIYIASFDSSCATKLKDASLGYISLTMNSD